MTGFNAKRQMAKAKLDDDDDTQVYADTLLIVYQRGFADGKKAAQRKPLTDELYNELLFAVGSKYPNETRHQTALRYIKRAEMRSASPAKAAHNIKEGT